MYKLILYKKIFRNEPTVLSSGKDRKGYVRYVLQKRVSINQIDLN